MTFNVKKGIDSYINWLRQGIKHREINGYVEITTPFLDRNNDYLQIYIKNHLDKILITDDSYTIQDLSLSGFTFNSKKRQALLQQVLNIHGVTYNKKTDALEVYTTEKSYPQRKHDLIQAILQINDLFNLSEPYVASIFYEDVIAWLDKNEIRYTPNLKFTGKTGFTHAFDFVIPKSTKYPERFLRAINRPSRESAESMVLAWEDIKEITAANSKAYAFLNDIEEVSHNVTDALTSYDIIPILWKKRDIFKEQLAA